MSANFKLDFSTLADNHPKVAEQIDRLLGPNGLGYCVITNIPKYDALRSKLLEMGHQLLIKPKDELAYLRSKSEDFYVGYSDNPFVTDDGIMHTMHTSFVARPLQETSIAPDKPELEQGLSNIWPKNDEFSTVFQEFGRIIAMCQLELFKSINKWLEKKVYGFLESACNNIIKDYDVVSRLINYHPVEDFTKDSDDITWDGWHTDYGLITALTHPTYWDAAGTRIICPKTCLWIKDRQGKSHEILISESDLVLIPSNSFLFLSGGLIPPTAHLIKISQGMPRNLYRTTIATFFQPQPSYCMSIPGGRTFDEIKKSTFHMSDFFEDGISFGAYSDRLLDYLISRKGTVK
jgi:isopenicillin N synthase-like dioxygenase